MVWTLPATITTTTKKIFSNGAPSNFFNSDKNIYNENKQKKFKHESPNLFDLSIPQIFRNIANTIHNIIYDILNYNSNDSDNSSSGILNIFFKDDRLLYLGIIIIIVGILIFILIIFLEIN